MINLRRLQSIGEKSSDEGLRRVVDYILAKIQRDKTEFSRYNYDEDWIEFDHYLSQLPRHNRGLNVLREVVHSTLCCAWVID